MTKPTHAPRVRLQPRIDQRAVKELAALFAYVKRRGAIPTEQELQDFITQEGRTNG